MKIVKNNLMMMKKQILMKKNFSGNILNKINDKFIFSNDNFTRFFCYFILDCYQKSVETKFFICLANILSEKTRVLDN